MSEKLTIKQLLEVGAHFGHHVRYWNPKMAQYIFCTRNKVHIIDLEQTLKLFQETINFLGGIVARRGKILFVGTKISAREWIKKEATRCGMPYVDYRWLGGMLTNYKTIRQSLKRLKEKEALRDSDIFKQMTKKESLSLTREITKLEKSLGGIREMGGVPDAIFVIDVGYENIAVTEARKLKIPVVGIVDTNNSPEGVDYVIPGNDDAARAIKLYLANICDAILDVQATLPVVEEVKEEKAPIKNGIYLDKKRVMRKRVENNEKVEDKSEEKKIKEENVAVKSVKKVIIAKVTKTTEASPVDAVSQSKTEEQKRRVAAVVKKEDKTKKGPLKSATKKTKKDEE